MERKYLCTAAAALAGAGAFAAVTLTAGTSRSLYLIPIMFLLPACVLLQFKDKKLKCSPETLMNETPSVIGMMSVTLSSGGSFDSAVREIAKNGPRYMSEIFRKIILDADCRVVSDIRAAVIETVSSFPKALAPFKRAMHIIVTAFDSADVSERADMMKDAENIVLEGLRSIGESYSSSLNSPCMLIFGLGIMVPMILISMLPMLSIGGMFSVSFIDSNVVTMIVLVEIPVVVGDVAISLRGKNPFFKVEYSADDLRYLMPLAVAVPIHMICGHFSISSELSISLSFIIAGLLTFAVIYPSILKEKERVRTEEALKDALFELGNRMSMGDNFENAIKKALSSRKDCISLCEKVERELVICRGDIESMIIEVIGPISEEMTGHYCDIYRASLRDMRNAGRLATGIAHQIQDQNAVRKNIENKLKSTMDMMTGTSAIFAPIILGMSIVMLGPITDITGQVFFDDIGKTLSIYLIELAALISLMSSNLMCRGKTIDVMARFCLMMPVALMVFLVFSSFSL